MTFCHLSSCPKTPPSCPVGKRWICKQCTAAVQFPCAKPDGIDRGSWNLGQHILTSGSLIFTDSGYCLWLVQSRVLFLDVMVAVLSTPLQKQWGWVNGGYSFVHHLIQATNFFFFFSWTIQNSSYYCLSEDLCTVRWMSAVLTYTGTSEW